MTEILRVENLTITYYSHSGSSQIGVKNINFSLNEGEIYGIVGESGSGKSTILLAIMGLLYEKAKIEGKIYFRGKEIQNLNKKEMKEVCFKEIGLIFQNQMESLNPSLTIERQILEILRKKFSDKNELQKKLDEVLEMVGLELKNKKKYPHELSGGMRQRVMIAMALACQPSLLICDEPTTALDVTVQAQILQIIDRMKQDLGTAVMLITHDMGVVSEMADWVLVMYAGHRVEYAQSAELFTNPLHPYAQGLIASIPSFDERTKELYAIPGSVPMLSHMPSGCTFHPRCPFAKDICKNRRPSLTAVGEDNCHTVSCWKYTDEWGE